MIATQNCKLILICRRLMFDFGHTSRQSGLWRGTSHETRYLENGKEVDIRYRG